MVLTAGEGVLGCAQLQVSSSSPSSAKPAAGLVVAHTRPVSEARLNRRW